MAARRLQIQLTLSVRPELHPNPSLMKLTLPVCCCCFFTLASRATSKR